ncbi:hypothetical protein PODOV061v2_0026 [Vibrio phage 172P1]|nr:hypothetical protein PODOV061v2_0026 [Vibrio phage 172P1]
MVGTKWRHKRFNVTIKVVEWDTSTSSGMSEDWNYPTLRAPCYLFELEKDWELVDD